MGSKKIQKISIITISTTCFLLALALVPSYGYNLLRPHSAAASDQLPPTIDSPPAAIVPAGNSTTTPPSSSVATTPVAGGAPQSAYSYVNKINPSRTEVFDARGWAATFTLGSRTVNVRGPSRVFAEPATTTARVTHSVWVRLSPSPYTGTINEQWLSTTLADTSPDVLAVAMQYTEGADTLKTSDGIIYASNADYGPLGIDGIREEGSDFNDYLGISQTYPDGHVDGFEPLQKGSLDCSGFMRMVWGYRMGLALTYRESTDGTALPRRAVQLYDKAPGTLIILRDSTSTKDLSRLNPGDLVFFDASADDGTAIDHVGMYVGVDNSGHTRFISSRKKANGPTIGDVGGRSILDGTGLYAKTFTGARRL